MARQLRKAQREIINVLEEAGASVKAIRPAANHLRAEYSFGDSPKTFITNLPHGTAISPRWLAALRVTLRHQKSQLS